MGRGRSARQKGHAYERKIVKELKELGFLQAKTARYASKEKDDQLVDIVGCDPLNIQAKAWEKPPNYINVLDKMPQDDNYNMIFHKKNRKPEIVIMYKEDFYKILKDLLTKP
jgi:hypothetical protein